MAERAEAEADMGDDVAMTESESDDDRPLLPKAPAAAPPPAALAAAERAPTKLKLKLKVGGVSALAWLVPDLCCCLCACSGFWEGCAVRVQLANTMTHVRPCEGRLACKLSHPKGDMALKILHNFVDCPDPGMETVASWSKPCKPGMPEPPRESKTRFREVTSSLRVPCSMCPDGFVSEN